jgi:hypothetical protein
MKLLSLVLNYSEVWALTVPILIWIIKKPANQILNPVKTFLAVSLTLNIIIDLANFKAIYHNNNAVYNLSSIFRLGVFVWFFSKNNIPISTKKILFPIFFIAIVIVANYLFWNSFTKFSSITFSIEGVVLITYCVIYFLRKLKSDEFNTAFDPSLYIVTGLSIYEAVCFPIFLFYDTLTNQTKDYAVNIWDVHNIAYIVFCLFIARAFYGSSRRTAN